MPLMQKAYTEEEFYNLPEDVHAELIDGQIYNQAAPSRIHQKILSVIHVEIGSYIKSKGGSCEVYPAPFDVKLREDRPTIVQPDISVICDKNKLTDWGCLGAPDWIVEIVSPGNSSHDYVRKLSLYANNGVREYWIVDPSKRIVLVYHLEELKFGVSIYGFEDRIKVNIYEDLYIDFAQLKL